MARGHTLLFLCLAVALLVSACGAGAAEEPATTSTEMVAEPSTAGDGSCVSSGFGSNCPVPGYPDRPFDLDVPETLPSSAPLLVVLHGGGGNSETARQRACPGGDLSSSSCFKAVGEAEGFITVYPNGTGGVLAGEVRTWNAGGGGDYACVSGRACDLAVDDVAYVSALLDELERQYHIDQTRIYVTGFSNGAALAHRLGCELSWRIAAIAPVSGGNQYATTAGCDPVRPVSVAHAHGTADPCWTYEESSQACLEQDDRPKVGVAESIEVWVERLGCDPLPESSAMPDTADDDMTTTVEVWGDCMGDSEVRLATVVGGGHAYPGGSPGIERIAGSPTEDWGFEEIWAFLSRFRIGG